jgi:hypothetical protein
MMKQFAILALLACALCAVQGRQLKQAQTLEQALASAQNTRVSTLIAAVQVGWLRIAAAATDRLLTSAGSSLDAMHVLTALHLLLHSCHPPLRRRLLASPSLLMQPGPYLPPPTTPSMMMM